MNRVGLLESELDSVLDIAGTRLQRVRELEDHLEKITCPICGNIMTVIYTNDATPTKIHPEAPIIHEVIMSCTHPRR